MRNLWPAQDLMQKAKENENGKMEDGGWKDDGGRKGWWVFPFYLCAPVCRSKQCDISYSRSQIMSSTRNDGDHSNHWHSLHKPNPGMLKQKGTRRNFFSQFKANSLCFRRLLFVLLKSLFWLRGTFFDDLSPFYPNTWTSRRCRQADNIFRSRTKHSALKHRK
jgi:hypothetical protein